LAPDTRSRLIDAFSPRRNLRTLFFRPPGHLFPVDGLRALSILWVVLFHAGWYSAFYVSRPTYAALLGSPWMLPVWRGDFGVDVFFVLSGFLIAGVLIDEKDRHGDIHLGLFQVRRFLRTWPALAVAVAIDVTLFHDNVDKAWLNLVYLSNFVPVARVCMGWTWSLSIEEQFYLLCPWLLRSIFPLATRGRLLVLACLAASLSCVAAVVAFRGGYHPFDAEIALNRAPERWTVAFDHLYTKPWMRAGPLLAGVAAAFAYRAREVMSLLGRARVGGSIGLLVALGAGALATHWPIAQGAPRAVEIAYLATYRLAFAMAVAYVMLLSLSAHPIGAALGRALALPFWYPLGQLSYSAYLLNPIVTTYVHRALAVRVAQSHTQPLLAFAPLDAVATFVAAAALHVLIERPMLNLRPRRKKALLRAAHAPQ
jgi:peptidoglycan/LPS O-acetylase OafA/YrhL